MMELNPLSPARILYWKDKIEALARGELPYPVSVDLDPSNSCSSHCPWCLFAHTRQENAFLDTEVALKVIEELKYLGVKSIMFTGGAEPLVHPDITKLLYKAKEVGLRIGLSTNGDMFVKDEILEAISETCRFINVSIDAGSDSLHYELKHPPMRNQLSTTFRNIGRLRRISDNTFDIGVSYVIHPDNYEEVRLFINKASKLPITHIRLKPCLNSKSTPEMRKYVDAAVKAFRHSRVPIIYSKERLREMEWDKGYTKCMAHYFNSIIQANGDVTLCCYGRGKKEWTFGNIYNNTFEEIWESQEHKDVISKIKVSECPVCGRYGGFNTILEQVENDSLHLDFL